MKRTILSLMAALCVAVCFNTAKAQSFEQGTITVSAGYGFGNFKRAVFKALESEAGYEFNSLGPVFVKGEYGISDRIGLGVNFAYFGMNVAYDFDGVDANFDPKTYSAEIKHTTMSVLARMNIHFANSDIVDPYFGFGVGVRTGRWSYDDNDPSAGVDFVVPSTGLPLGFETTLGLRVYPISNLGIYAEVGAAKALAQLGLTFKI